MSEWRAELDWADVVVFDDIWVDGDIGTGEIAQELRERDVAVVGGTPNTDRLEADRGYAMAVLEDHGVNTIDHLSSTTFRRASTTSGRTRSPTSSSLSARSRTSIACCTSGARPTAATWWTYWRPTRRRGATG